MKLKAPDPMTDARKYLRTCPPAISGQFGSNATFRTVCVLVRKHGLSEEQALEVMQDWNRTCQPPWEDYELRRKIQGALCSTSQQAKTLSKDGVVRKVAVRHRKPEFKPATLARVAARLPGVDFDYVRARSPLRPDTQTPASFLQRLYRPGEWVLVFDVFKSQGLYLCQGTEPPYDADCLNHLIHGCPDGVWYLSNPVDGKFHPNPREGGKLSQRSEESVTSWRYLVLESDDADELHWLSALAQMPLRIGAIYTSGRRSIHALVRVDAMSKADWDAKLKPIKRLLIEIGACQGSITAVRLTRLPGCYRDEQGPRAPRQLPVRKRWVDEPLKYDANGDPIWIPDEPVVEPVNHWTGGKPQELLYLNPDPELEPICKKRTQREIHQEWLAEKRRQREGLAYDTH